MEEATPEVSAEIDLSLLWRESMITAKEANVGVAMCLGPVALASGRREAPNRPDGIPAAVPRVRERALEAWRKDLWRRGSSAFGACSCVGRRPA